MALGLAGRAKPVAKLARTLQTQSITSAPASPPRVRSRSTAPRVRARDDGRAQRGGASCSTRWTRSRASNVRRSRAFYVFPKFTATEKGSQIANILLEDGLIASTPGIAFGQAGEGPSASASPRTWTAWSDGDRGLCRRLSLTMHLLGIGLARVGNRHLLIQFFVGEANPLG
ncbi:MAG: hypothetical protein R2838_05745 [Caldilineaceae bacterium]